MLNPAKQITVDNPENSPLDRYISLSFLELLLHFGSLYFSEATALCPGARGFQKHQPGSAGNTVCSHALCSVLELKLHLVYRCMCRAQNIVSSSAD
jgi:hypothetical protein